MNRHLALIVGMCWLVLAPVDSALEGLGSISGRVRDAATGEPIPFITVGAERELLGIYSQTDASGRYLLEGLEAGDWTVRTVDGLEYQDELYDDVPCPFGGCDLSKGTRVPVAPATTTAGIDFALDRQGSISGVVRDAVTGAPLVGFDVQAVEITHGLIRFDETDSLGRYTLPGLAPGDYWVSTEERSSQYQDELYDDIPCHRFSCDVNTGTPVVVGLGTDVEGVDFALERLGSISGRVTDATTGEPISSVSIDVVDAAGNLVRPDQTDDSGFFTVDGLVAGSYFVVAFVRTHQTGLYDGFVCQPGCDPTVGTPVAVSFGNETRNIDFSLVRLGSISGTVTDAATGEQLAPVDIQVRSTDGQVSENAFGSSGRYTIPGLPAGTYWVTAFSGSAYVNQRYDGIACVADGCAFGGGTPVTVNLDATTGGIDFALQRASTIAGTVTDSVSGLPAAANLSLWDAGGKRLLTEDSVFDGRYLFQRLPAGTYFVTADRFGYVPELYDDLPCPPESCDPTTGTPIVVGTGGVTPGIDFALTPIVDPTCVPSQAALCLSGGRFKVEVTWRDFAGASGAGQGVGLTADTGTFWFFGPDNIEVVVKVLDACFDPFDRFWVFAAGLTDVETELTVTDTVSGEVRTYPNPLGTSFQPIQDTAAFMTCPPGADGQTAAASELAQRSRLELEALLARLDAAEALAQKAPGTCIEDAETLCLNGDRFEVRAAWETPAEESGEGQAVRLSADTGYFWFFDGDNVEAVVKVLDACNLDPFNNFWVFAAGLTDVKVTLTVTDTVSKETRQWVNPQGTAFRPILETGLFMTCP